MEKLHDRLDQPYPHLLRLGEELRTICAASEACHGLSIQRVDVVVNIKAGGVGKRIVFEEHLARIRALRRRIVADARHDPDRHIPTALYVTEYHGHAREIARRIVFAAECEAERRLIVSVGGDGTHADLMSMFYQAPQRVLDRLVLLRLPFGTGDDNADGRTVEAACELLLHHSALTRAAAVRMDAVGMSPRFAFNIASIGIDAFITGVTNRLKRFLPRNAYRMIANLTTIFYEWFNPLGDMTLIRDPRSAHGGTVSPDLRGRIALVAFGVSGDRTYGNGMRILPGPENVCAISTGNLFRKLEIKRRLYHATHLETDLAHSFAAQRLLVQYDRRVAYQIDGEAAWLSPQHFPVVFTIVEGRIPVFAHAT
ncbi:MAG: diacylglycerol/lipid kinase family protein [Spirochaetaceae bacterium]